MSFILPIFTTISFYSSFKNKLDLKVKSSHAFLVFISIYLFYLILMISDSFNSHTNRTSDYHANALHKMQSCPLRKKAQGKEKQFFHQREDVRIDKSLGTR